MPPLNFLHKNGGMSLLDREPIVVGGSDQEGLHGIVEIFKKETNQWVLGPEIPYQEEERPPSVIAVNRTTIVVVGGHKKSMNMLQTSAMIWHSLADYPFQCWHLVCGLLHTNVILCVGGRDFSEENKSFAYALDLSLVNATWVRRQNYETSNGVMQGFLFRIREVLYCMSTSTGYYEQSNRLQKMRLDDFEPEWEVVKLFPNNYFASVGPYLAQGFKIEFQV